MNNKNQIKRKEVFVFPLTSMGISSLFSGDHYKHETDCDYNNRLYENEKYAFTYKKYKREILMLASAGVGHTKSLEILTKHVFDFNENLNYNAYKNLIICWARYYGNQRFNELFEILGDNWVSDVTLLIQKEYPKEDFNLIYNKNHNSNSNNLEMNDKPLHNSINVPVKNRSIKEQINTLLYNITSLTNNLSSMPTLGELEKDEAMQIDIISNRKASHSAIQEATTKLIKIRTKIELYYDCVYINLLREAGLFDAIERYENLVESYENYPEVEDVDTETIIEDPFKIIQFCFLKQELDKSGRAVRVPNFEKQYLCLYPLNYDKPICQGDYIGIDTYHFDILNRHNIPAFVIDIFENDGSYDKSSSILTDNRFSFRFNTFDPYY